ncbi:MAG TPA: dNTP triphosphohydrolase, partial [Kiloniellaceae bacterium]|nr:dNTP triphosphohydrolase [Kiloniellaceae bacterium]
MEPFGGFDHNEQTFRVVTHLEQRYAEFDGLNLTWESLEGLVKHNGPLPTDRPLPASIAAFQAQMDLEPQGYASAEAQVASLSDDIAYTNHDIDDGLRAGLFDFDDLRALPLLGDIIESLTARYPGLDTSRLIHETVRRLIDRMVTDLLAETRRRLRERAPPSVAEIRGAGAPIVAFSKPLQAQIAVLSDFLFRRMYRHDRVNESMGKAKEVVRCLFAQYQDHPDSLPEDWRGAAVQQDPQHRARLVADYIAGMTDRYALMEYARIFKVEAVRL